MVDFTKLLKEKQAKELLEKQLAQVKKASAPSMIPHGYKRHVEKEKEPPPPDLRELDIPKALSSKLAQAVERIAAITLAQGQLKKEKTELVNTAKPLCKLYSLEKFQVGENRACYYKSVRSAISRDLLLAVGVSPKVIAECTTTTESWSFKATGPKSDDEGEE